MDTKNTKNTKEVKEIKEVKMFINEEDHKVTAFFPINSKTLEIDQEGDILFNGEIILMSQRGPMSFAFEFPGGYNLEKCFEEFETIAKQELDLKMAEQQEAQRIITPNGGNNDNQIIMP